MPKKLICSIILLLIISLLFLPGCATIKNALFPDTEPKVISTPTLDQDFVDNQVLLLMQKYASQRQYTADDFKKVGCIKVEYLTYEKQLLEGQNLSLLLTLDTHSKENVIKVISKLQKRRDVVAAEPAYYAYPAAVPGDYGYPTQ